MNGSDLYFERYAWPGPLIKNDPDRELEMVVVVPAFNEPDVIRSLQALKNCSYPGVGVEVLAVINHPEGSPAEVLRRSRETFERIKNWSERSKSAWMRFFPVWAGELKKKFAGPGLARKIGMDEAARRLKRAGHSNGLIVSYDADCTCEGNYLSELYGLYRAKGDFRGCAVYYEHVPEPDEKELSLNIVNYELHLRYYSGALAYAGYPFPFHTIGSTMTVSARAYTGAGGMNRRKAGEDFFFLQKIFPDGGFYNLNRTVVYPSSRKSDRVPFGTGATMLKLGKRQLISYLTYNMKSFYALRDFLLLADRWYGMNDPEVQKTLERLPSAMSTWLKKNDFAGQIRRIRDNSATPQTFRKSFFRWFSRFQVLKYVHFARDHFYPDVDVSAATDELMKRRDPSWSGFDDRRELLMAVRKFDRERN